MKDFYRNVFQGLVAPDAQRCLVVLDKLRDLIISYAGLTLQEPEMFRQPQGYGHVKFIRLEILTNLPESLWVPLNSSQACYLSLLSPCICRPDQVVS